MILLFDIGTKTRIAATSDLTSFSAPIKFDTPHAYADALATFRTRVREVAGGARVRGVVVGIRGPRTADHRSLESETTLSDWVYKPLLEDIAQMCEGAEVILENDAALAGLGEATFGAGKGYRIVAYHTVSTGVGGSRIVDETIDAAHSGFEPGHQVIDIDGSVGGAGAHTLEDLISGTALEKRFGKKPYDIAQSDPIWDELAHYLALGIHNTITYWSPDIVVLGGSMVVGDPKIFVADVLKHLRNVAGGSGFLPNVVEAALGDQSGLYGALRLAQHHF
jgi:predicted NBD/HSP70 family sugar kinase